MSGILNHHPIDKRAKLYPSLREMCLNYRFWPFQQLHIEEIAARFSASTTPVREALARLAGEGLIESVPNRGYFAKAMSVEEVRCRVEILFLLLQHALRGCSLPDAWSGTKELVTPSDVLAADRFYISMAAMSDNILILPEVERQLDLTCLIRAIDLENPERQVHLHAQLLELQSCLKDGDAESASLCLQRQQDDLKRRLPHLVQDAQLRMLVEISTNTSALSARARSQVGDRKARPTPACSYGGVKPVRS